ncbi:MAG: four-carbon acid sugar kinase family protein [Micromonosporaceae bacterium]
MSACNAVVLADDLTGALDTTAAIARRGTPGQVWLRPPAPTGLGADDGSGVGVGKRGGVGGGECGVVGVDLGTRDLDAATAAAQVRDAVAGAPDGWLIYQKVDSLLRGAPGVDVRAALTAATARFGGVWVALVASAFPATGRTVRDGKVRLAGDESAATDVAAVFAAAGLHTAAVHLPAVRAGAEALCVALASLVESGVAAVVLDAVTVDDLQVIAEAGRRLAVRSGPAAEPCHVLWVGSAGLAGELITADREAAGADLPDPHLRVARSGRRPVLAVVGTSHPRSQRQRALLSASRGTTQVELRAAALLEPQSPAAVEGRATLAAAVETGADLVVSIESRGAPGPQDPRLVGALAALLAPVAAGFGGFILTGGTTASAVLQAMAVVSVRVRGQVEPGVVVSAPVADPTRLVVTKSGGFGDDRSLVRAYDAVTGRSPTTAIRTCGRTAS